MGSYAAAAGDGSDLAARQAALVAALVAGAPPQPGFAPHLVAAARAALLRKRAGEVAAAWPQLAAAQQPQWRAVFATWAAGRPPAGALRDGWDLARHLAATNGLPGPAAAELAAREATLHYRGTAAPRRRRWPALRRRCGAVAVQLAGRVFLVRVPQVAAGASSGPTAQ